MRYEDIRNYPQRFKALTSYDVKKFDELLLYFENELEDYFQHYTFNGKPRKNKYTPKSKDPLPTAGDKLFFILYYLKNNPTQEALAYTFDLQQDMCNKWIQLLAKILSKALKSYQPEQNPHRLVNQLNENEEYTVDGTERLVQRDHYVQEEFFSGKKKHIQ